MTACAEYRSIFDLCPDDEALTGLREVNPVLRQAAVTDPAPEGLYEAVVPVVKKVPFKFLYVWKPCMSFHTELEDKSPEDDRQRESSLAREVSDKMVCSACRCSFNNREEQVSKDLWVVFVQSAWVVTWVTHVLSFNRRWSTTSSTGTASTWDRRCRGRRRWQLRSLRGRQELVRKTTGVLHTSVRDLSSWLIFSCWSTGDMSSISGSESDSEEEDLDSDSGGGGRSSSNVNGTDNESSAESSSITGRPLSRIVFQNSAGQYLSVYRCVLQGKVRLSCRYNAVQNSVWAICVFIAISCSVPCLKLQSDDEQDAGSSLKAISKKTVWIVLMTGGGHFAGAVFQG